MKSLIISKHFYIFISMVWSEHFRDYHNFFSTNYKTSYFQFQLWVIFCRSSPVFDANEGVHLIGERIFSKISIQLSERVSQPRSFPSAKPNVNWAPAVWHSVKTLTSNVIIGQWGFVIRLRHLIMNACSLWVSYFVTRILEYRYDINLSDSAPARRSQTPKSLFMFCVIREIRNVP